MVQKKSIVGITFDVFNTLLMLLVFIVMLYPFLYVINCSLSTPGAVSKNPLLLLPVKITFDSYAMAFSDPGIYKALWISISRSVLGPLGMILVSGMAAYVLSKKDLIAGKFFRVLMFFTMYFSAGIIPVYLLYSSLKITGTYWVYILPNVVQAFNIVLIKSYIESLPESLEEAVLIDGGNELIAYWAVIFQVCLPVNAAVFLFSAITHWNSFIDTQLYNAMTPALYTMQYVLYNTLASQLQQSLEAAKAGGAGTHVSAQSLKMAFTVITVIPVMLFYPFMQKYFVSGIIAGSIKA